MLKFHLSRALPCGIEVVPVLSLPIELMTGVSQETQTQTVFDNKHDTGRQLLIDSTLSLVRSQHAYCIRDVMVGDDYMYALESPGFLGIGGKVGLF